MDLMDLGVGSNMGIMQDDLKKVLAEFHHHAGRMTYSVDCYPYLHLMVFDKEIGYYLVYSSTRIARTLGDSVKESVRSLCHQ